ncbi:uroporphyrinogen-III synthase [Beggiatoa alba]|nr:uroporphyrinogen-III synthase [Beggiatoa alba]
MNQISHLPLANKHIMVTRPAHQASQLIRLLEQAGARIYCLPLIKIIAIVQPTAAIAQVKQLEQTDIAIFISQNAVIHGFQLIQQQGGLPSHIKLATVGQGSANLLEKTAQRPVEIVPQGSYNSEGLLAHPLLQNVSTQKITIFRGIGGRNLLADSLRKRGADVEYAEVYQRHQPIINLQQLAKDWHKHAIDYICITSGEGLENLVSKLSEKSTSKSLRTDILNCHLVIVNRRLESLVKKYKFSQPVIIADNVTDKAIVDAIIKQAD